MSKAHCGGDGCEKDPYSSDDCQCSCERCTDTVTRLEIRLQERNGQINDLKHKLECEQSVNQDYLQVCKQRDQAQAENQKLRDLLDKVGTSRAGIQGQLMGAEQLLREGKKDSSGNPWAPNKDFPGKPVSIANRTVDSQRLDQIRSIATDGDSVSSPLVFELLDHIEYLELRLGQLKKASRKPGCPACDVTEKAYMQAVDECDRWKTAFGEEYQKARALERQLGDLIAKNDRLQSAGDWWMSKVNALTNAIVNGDSQAVKVALDMRPPDPAEKPKDPKYVFCLEHRRVMVDNKCPVCVEKTI